MNVRFWLALTLAISGLLLLPAASRGQARWKDVQKSGKGAITAFWFPNEPFGFKAPDGHLKGIEVEIVRGFQDYLRAQHHVDLSIKWVEQRTFKEVLDKVRHDTTGGVIGVTGFSFTEERKTFMKFSPSYMADMAVLVSTQDIPVIRSQEDLIKYFDDATALTAEGTILEKELIQLRAENNLHFRIEYTGGSEELIKILKKSKKSFGYLNLPIYLMDVDKGHTGLNRQNYLTKLYEGRGIGLSKSGDWDEPIREYFASRAFQDNIEPIIGQYFNIDLYHFVETLTPENEIGLLNREKNLQLMQLKVKELTIREKNQKQNFLMGIIAIVSVLLLVIGLQFRKQKQSNDLLKEQKAEIEAQAEHIKSINDNLERLIRERTRELENKNKALEEYAFITAHKLRAPLASILGLVGLVEKMPLQENDQVIINHLSTSSKKLDEVIHSAMDALETTQNWQKDHQGNR